MTSMAATANAIDALVSFLAAGCPFHLLPGDIWPPVSNPKSGEEIAPSSKYVLQSHLLSTIFRIYPD